MLRRLPIAALPAWFMLCSANAMAEPPVVSKTPATSQVRRDPRGIKGISPFNEALARGDQALLSHDFEGAIVAYRDAIAKEPENALAHYRVGEVQIIKGDLQGAETAFNAGLHLVSASNRSLKAKLLFALAELRERQKAYDEASARWTEYETLTTAQSDARGFPGSSSERKKAIETWKKLESDSLAVKARIEKGVQAADEAVKKSAK